MNIQRYNVTSDCTMMNAATNGQSPRYLRSTIGNAFGNLYFADGSHGIFTINDHAPESIRALPVDDDLVYQRQIARFVLEAGHEVFTASNGREALPMAREHSPHLVIKNWVMPEMDGPELCKALRNIPRGALLYIIMLTTYEDEARLLEAFAAGAYD